VSATYRGAAELAIAAGRAQRGLIGYPYIDRARTVNLHVRRPLSNWIPRQTTMHSFQHLPASVVISTLLFAAVAGSPVEAQTAQTTDVPPNPCESDPRAGADPECLRGRQDIPEVFYDIPSCPLRPEIRQEDGARGAGLVNYSETPFVFMLFGYVEPVAGKVHVVAQLSGYGRSHGGIASGEWIGGLFPNDGCPCNSWILLRPKAYASLGQPWEPQAQSTSDRLHMAAEQARATERAHLRLIDSSTAVARAR